MKNKPTVEVRVVVKSVRSRTYPEANKWQAELIGDQLAMSCGKVTPRLGWVVAARAALRLADRRGYIVVNRDNVVKECEYRDRLQARKEGMITRAETPGRCR